MAIVTRAPKSNKEYYLGDRKIDETLFNNLNNIKTLSSLGVPDKLLYESLMSYLNPDPRQTELEDMTLRTKALEEAAYLKQMGQADQANTILAKYYNIPQNMSSDVISNDVLTGLETQLSTTTDTEKMKKLRAAIAATNQYGSNIDMGGADLNNIRQDAETKRWYVDPGFISPQQRMEFLRDNPDVLNSMNSYSSPLTDLLIPGASRGIGMYAAVGDLINQRGRQYINM